VDKSGGRFRDREFQSESAGADEEKQKAEGVSHEREVG
jgi:hypothetical protein